MSTSDVNRDGLHGARPDREATPGAPGGSGGRRRGSEQPVMPGAQPTSYYGMPVLNRPTWKAPDIPGYLYLGGLAGAGSVLAAGATLTGRPRLARAAKLGAVAGVSLSLAALVHDLGRPARFLNMLRVIKPTSPMSMGSWLLSVYGPLAGAAAVTDVTGRFRRAGHAATVAAALTGPALATYTAVLISDTAVPAWHDAYRELPYLFAGSASAAAAGLGLIAAPTREAGPARRLALLGAATELLAGQLMEHRLGEVAEPYTNGRSGRLMRTAKALTGAGAIGAALLGRRSRIGAAACGAALMAGSAITRFAVFEAGLASADDPKYTVGPQRDRLTARGAATRPAADDPAPPLRRQ